MNQVVGVLGVSLIAPTISECSASSTGGIMVWGHSKVGLLCRWTAHPPRVLWARGYVFFTGRVRATSERKPVGSGWQCRGPNKYLDSQRRSLLCLKGIAARGPPRGPQGLPPGAAWQELLRRP